MVGMRHDDILVEYPIPRTFGKAIAKLTLAGKIASIKIEVVDFNLPKCENTNHLKTA